MLRDLIKLQCYRREQRHYPFSFPPSPGYCADADAGGNNNLDKHWRQHVARDMQTCVINLLK